MRFDGRRVLITGGGSGVGADLARGFALAGAEVIIAGRRKDALDKVAARLPGVRGIPSDVTDESKVRALFAEAGNVDIVIANAGIAESAPFARTTIEQWNAMLAVNLTGTYLTLREGLKEMKGWGRLIAVASTAGIKGYPYVAPYVAAKHGVVGLVRAIALEIAKRPITANALCPGFLETEMTDRSIATIATRTGRPPSEARRALEAHNPQGRLLSPAEVTAAALWLCHPGSEGVNGQAIVISGGEV
jgi:3-hydroxybutyrate dehydrogenase